MVAVGTPVAWLTCRRDSLSPNVSRRTSRIFRMTTRGRDIGIAPPTCAGTLVGSLAEPGYLTPARPREPLSRGWPDSSEQVAGLDRNGWPDCVGIRIARQPRSSRARRV